MDDLIFSAQVLVAVVRGRAERARREGFSQRGATAIEWAIISAIVVGLAILVAGVIRSVVNSNVNKIGHGANP